MNARMNSSKSNPDWLEPVQNRRLGDAEIAVLRARVLATPREARWLDEELALNAALSARRLPAVSGDFASRVWLEIDRPGTATRSKPAGWAIRLAGWWEALRAGPAVAFGTVLVVAALGWGQVSRHQQSVQAANLSEISRTAPDVEVLRDFESIRAMAVKPEPGDLALIAALDGSSAVH